MRKRTRKILKSLPRICPTFLLPQEWREGIIWKKLEQSRAEGGKEEEEQERRGQGQTAIVPLSMVSVSKTTPKGKAV